MKGIEITQAIQSLDQDVALIAGKQTAVRVYLSLNGAGPLSVNGTLLGRRGSASLPEVKSINMVRFSIADTLTLQQKRANEARSLNFLLPADWVLEGALELKVTELTGEDGAPVTCDNCNNEKARVAFEKDAPLRIRLIGIRYKMPGSDLKISPIEKDFKLTESWLRRAYPVATVIASQGFTDANSAWEFDCNAINAQISAIRALDISGGTDPRTHYYGIVSDNDTHSFMRGCASGIPSSAEPATVASGPAGTSDLGWDFDGSYADWYTAHELAHTFGRKHPGFCGESTDDQSYPYPRGSISDGERYAGWDFGDPEVGVKMQTLDGSDWHDIMTYCDRQWMSRYTYLGIRQRLIAEDALGTGGVAASILPMLPEAEHAVSSRGRRLFGAPVAEQSSESGSSGPEEGLTVEERTEAGEDLSGAAESSAQAGMVEEGTFVSVIATVNLTQGSGKILYLNPISKAVLSTSGRVGSPATLRLKGTVDGEDVDIPAVINFDTDRGPSGERTGLIDVFVPVSARVKAMDLLLNGRLVDSKAFGPSPPQVTRLQIGTKEGERRGGLSLFRRRDKDVDVLQWDGVDLDNGSITYSVQQSSNLGKTWETLAVGLRQRELELDQGQQESVRGRMFRIIANDGMNSTYITTTEPINGPIK